MNEDIMDRKCPRCASKLHQSKREPFFNVNKPESAYVIFWRYSTCDYQTMETSNY